MGFQLFETSGTFNPATWGLKAGDPLHIICVGGGGGGGGGYNSSALNGANGSASSFGSIVTAAGGNGGMGGKNYMSNNTIQSGSCPGSQAYFTSNLGGAPFAGSGGDGWIPGSTFPRCAATPPGDNTNGFGISDSLGHVWIVGAGISTASTIDRGNNGYGNSNYVGGCGGIGYGAGGGGSNRTSSDSYSGAGGNGGNSGVKTTAFYILPSTDSIAVTVGTGGTGSGSSTYGPGGGGARGCVCVFW